MSEPTQTTQPQDSRIHWLMLAACGGTLLLASTMSIRESRQVLLPVVQVPLPELCTMRRTTGVACPGCGMTRSFVSLAHGQLAAAWSYHPAGPLLFVLVAFQLPWRTAQLWRIRHGMPELMIAWAIPVVLIPLLILIVGQWAARAMGVQF